MERRKTTRAREYGIVVKKKRTTPNALGMNILATAARALEIRAGRIQDGGIHGAGVRGQ